MGYITPLEFAQEEIVVVGTGFRYTKNLSNDFNALLAKAGLVEKKNYRTCEADGKRRQYAGLSFHSLRHTTTSMLKNTGATSAIAGDVVPRL